MIAPHDDEEPKTVNEALFGLKSKEQIKAMEEEMQLMKTNQVLGLGSFIARTKSHWK